MDSQDFCGERRKNRRYTLKAVAFAVLQSDTDEELGEVVNISRNGLAFHYFVGNRKVGRGRYLDIMMPRNHLTISGIPVRTVSDFQIENRRSFGSVVKRQQSVCFESLTEEQQGKVDFLIEYLAVACRSV